MRKVVVTIVFAFIAISTFAHYQTLSVKMQKILIPTNGTVVHKAPYNGEPVTSSYNPSDKTLTVWFHYNMDNAEVVITKNGEVIASDVFDMEANEALEYDLSGCGEGEYGLIVVVSRSVVCSFNIIVNDEFTDM